MKHVYLHKIRNLGGRVKDNNLYPPASHQQSILVDGTTTLFARFCINYELKPRYIFIQPATNFIVKYAIDKSIFRLFI